jgi:hypothetical protein
MLKVNAKQIFGASLIVLMAGTAANDAQAHGWGGHFGGGFGGGYGSHMGWGSHFGGGYGGHVGWGSHFGGYYGFHRPWSGGSYYGSHYNTWGTSHCGYSCERPSWSQTTYQRPTYTPPVTVERPPVEYAPPRQVIVERPPVVVERPVDRPVYVDRPVDRPVYVDRPVDRPVYVDRPVDRPVYVDRPVIVERKVVVERPVDRPVYVDRPVVVERKVVVERPVYIERPQVVEHPPVEYTPPRVVTEAPAPNCDCPPKEYAPEQHVLYKDNCPRESEVQGQGPVVPNGYEQAPSEEQSQGYNQQGHSEVPLQAQGAPANYGQSGPVAQAR